MDVAGSPSAARLRPGFRRWTPAHKEELLADIRSGALSREAALERHGLTEEELAAWERHFRARGRAGLKVTRLKDRFEVPA